MPKSTIIPLLHHQQERGKEYLQAFLGQRRVGVMSRKHNQEASHLGEAAWSAMAAACFPAVVSGRTA